MKVLYRQSASDDVVRQFRYYLTDQNLPEVADRFLDAIWHTIQSIARTPSGRLALSVERVASSELTLMAGRWL